VFLGLLGFADVVANQSNPKARSRHPDAQCHRSDSPRCDDAQRNGVANE
jgi:hypothetical protein